MNKARRLVVLICVVVSFSMLCGFADDSAPSVAPGFSDLPAEHWAYEAVSKLAGDGTVSGFEDGSFRPDAPVTRAEFVKMLGERSVRRNDRVPDLSPRHWAYSYLLHSPLRTVDGKLLPDESATREQVAVYLYDCFAKGATGHAASVITRNTAYPNEIAWVYERGIMVGDDGLNLRLGDTLTRAEAATLIVNSRAKLENEQGLADALDAKILENVFTNSGLFDSEYRADAVLTNGEAARAAYRLQIGALDGLYYLSEADFEHPYARDLKAMEPILGAGRISAAFADKEAMPEDVLAMFAYAAASRYAVGFDYGAKDAYYPDANLASDSLNAPLTFSYRSGILPFGGGKLKSGTPVTHRTAAAVLLQYDMLWGLHTSVTVTRSETAYQNESLRFTALPQGAEMFKGILASVPNAVYEKPFTLVEGMEMTAEAYPARNYAFFHDLKDAFAGMLGKLSGEIYETYGVDVAFTFYPSLVYDTGAGFGVRAKATVLSLGETEVKANELFPDTGSDAPLAVGETYWQDWFVGYLFMMAGEEQ